MIARKRPPTRGTRYGTGAGWGPGWGGPARGMGWGGPPKGAGWGGEARHPRAGRGHNSGDYDEREERLRRLLYDLAFNAANQMVQLAAANALLDRIEGKPVARTVTVNPATLLTDAELAAEIERVKRALGEG